MQPPRVMRTVFPRNALAALREWFRKKRRGICLSAEPLRSRLVATGSSRVAPLPAGRSCRRKDAGPAQCSDSTWRWRRAAFDSPVEASPGGRRAHRPSRFDDRRDGALGAQSTPRSRTGASGMLVHAAPPSHRDSCVATRRHSPSNKKGDAMARDTARHRVLQRGGESRALVDAQTAASVARDGVDERNPIRSDGDHIQDARSLR